MKMTEGDCFQHSSALCTFHLAADRDRVPSRAWKAMKFIFNLKEGERFPEAIALSGWRPLLLGSFAGWRPLLRNKKLLVTSALLIVTRSY